jgi:hypothetical protein
VPQGFGVGFVEVGDTDQQVDEMRQVIRQLHESVLEFRLAFQTITHVAPPRPRDGMIRYADGVDWNPGAGTGYYARVSGVWTKM